ncbi:cytochrome c oxidase subunit 6B2 isoform X1 [Mesocricetus auratus]|uniref:Cytochrome c oxidase subunit 6B2 isoform X1 n=1 Tax=Mesocricetus auratus TaxID=10036 RepID=A0ABM2WLN7_MESAU|nr:cytochrome c oxidase subunit 6B2 isoform X1 [Mesocricetus auratus]XP_040590082.1 cytochrome c oxidase subunit 6B2 isoform X1 [Mesocricetus auratus]
MLDVEAQMPPPGEWKTPPFDPRFPNQNQTRNCYQNFLDYHRCLKTMNRRGKDTQPCEYYFRVFHSLCPISWTLGSLPSASPGAALDRADPAGNFPGQNLTAQLSAAPQ